MSKYISYCLLLIGIGVVLSSCTKTSEGSSQTIVQTIDTAVILKTTTSVVGDTTVFGIGKLKVTVTKTSPCYPSSEEFTFIADASGIVGATYYHWNYGDGYSDSGRIVQHGYNNSAPYVVQLEILDRKDAAIYTTTFPVKAWGQQLKPVAIFSTKNDFPQNVNYVTFNSASSVNHGSIVNFHWDWQDGSTSNTADALTRHQFPASTTDVTYQVKLTITTDAGCSADTTVPVWVPGAYPITGDFTFVQHDACTNEYFTFTAAATSVPTGSIYRWHWSDGTHDDSGYNAQHTFAYMNDYDVILYVVLNGRTIYTVHEDINAKGPDPKPMAAFYYTWVSESPTNVLVSFNADKSIIKHGGVSGYNWDFGNGQTNNNYETFTQTRYQREATGSGTKDYTVRLIVTGNGCADTAYKTVTIPSQ